MKNDTKKHPRKHASVNEDEGVNYREIAEMMSELGFQMNHSSARNYVIRVMRKFAKAVTTKWDVKATEKRIDEIAKSPDFQRGIAEILEGIESRRRVIKNRDQLGV